MLKRTLCAVLALIMLVCAVPLTALAEETEQEMKLGFDAGQTGMSNYVSEMKESENNSSRKKADYIPGDYTLVNGWVGQSKDEYDFFKITLDRSYAIEFSGIAANKAVKFKITNSSGKVLKTASRLGANSYGDQEYTLSYTVAPGTYYIRVTASSKVRAQYQFWFELVPAVAAPVVSKSYDAASGKPILSWNYDSEAFYYDIERSTSEDGTYTALGYTYGTSYMDTTAKPGRVYYYRVKAVPMDPDMRSSKYSSVAKTVCDCARPEVWLTYRSTTGKNIINWNAVEGAEEYKIYVATSPNGKYKCLKTTSKLKYVHSSGASNKTYYYKVKAISEKRESANSAYSLIVSQRTK